METAILSNHEDYGYARPIVGVVESSHSFDPKKKSLVFGDGRWLEVKEKDLVFIELSEKQVKTVFPFYE